MDDQKKALFDEAIEYLDWYKDEIEELKGISERLNKLQDISDQQIDAISNAAPGRGTQHYLIEHINNAVQLQNQKQSIIKDIRDIKKGALEMAIKRSGGEEENDSKAMMNSLQKAINEMNKKTAKLENKISDTKETTIIDLDQAIKEKLKNRS